MHVHSSTAVQVPTALPAGLKQQSAASHAPFSSAPVTAPWQVSNAAAMHANPAPGTSQFSIRHAPTMHLDDLAPGVLRTQGRALLPKGHETGTLLLNIRTLHPLTATVALRRLPDTRDTAVVALRDGSLMTVRRMPTDNGHVWVRAEEHGLRGGAYASPGDIAALVNIGPHDPISSSAGNAQNLIENALPGGHAVHFFIASVRHSLQQAANFEQAKTAVMVALHKVDSLSEENVTRYADGSVRVDFLTDHDNQRYWIVIEGGADRMASKFNIREIFSDTETFTLSAYDPNTGNNRVEADATGRGKKRPPSPTNESSPKGKSAQVDSRTEKADRIDEGLAQQVIAALQAAFPGDLKMQFAGYLRLVHDNLPTERLGALKGQHFDFKARTLDVPGAMSISLPDAVFNTFWRLASSQADKALFDYFQLHPVPNVADKLATLRDKPEFAQLTASAGPSGPLASVLPPWQLTALKMNASTRTQIVHALTHMAANTSFSQLVKECGYEGTATVCMQELVKDCVSGQQVLVSPYRKDNVSLRCSSVAGNNRKHVSVRVDLADVKVLRVVDIPYPPYTIADGMADKWNDQPDLKALKNTIGWEGTPAELVQAAVNPEQGEALSPPVKDVALYRSVLSGSNKEVALYARVVDGVVEAVSTSPEGIAASNKAVSATTSVAATSSTSAIPNTPSNTHDSLIRELTSDAKKTVYVCAATNDNGRERVSLANVEIIRRHPSAPKSVVFIGKSYFKQTRAVYQDSAAAEAILRAFIAGFPNVPPPRGSTPADIAVTVSHAGHAYTVRCHLSRTGEITGVRIDGLHRAEDDEVLAKALEEVITDQHAIVSAAQDRLIMFLHHGKAITSVERLQIVLNSDVKVVTHNQMDETSIHNLLKKRQWTLSAPGVRLLDAHRTKVQRENDQTAMLFGTSAGFQINKSQYEHLKNRYKHCLDWTALGLDRSY